MTSVANLDEQIERLKKCEYLKESEVKGICDRAREILVDESNVQRVDAPVTVRICLSKYNKYVQAFFKCILLIEFCVLFTKIDLR
jgi:hypothetical protein